MSYGKEGFVGLVRATDGYYDLHEKGRIDQARHKAKIREAVKENLPKIIGEEAIITSTGDRIVKVPIRSLELPRFRYKQNGQGTGEGPGKGKQAGNQPGTDIIEIDYLLAELEELVFEDLSLPFLKPKQQSTITEEELRYDEIRKKGIMGNLDKRRSLLENIKRNAEHGLPPRIGGIKEEDLRFRTSRVIPKPENNAVVIAMRDVSGSMGEFEKYITRSFFWWMTRFLRTKYKEVQIRFITHHTEAKEVDEQTFFNLAESGGTKVSSAYELTLDIIKRRYNPSAWNIYPFHFSDGDNWGDDNNTCLERVKEIMQYSNLFGYGEIREGGMLLGSPLSKAFDPLRGSDPRFRDVRITKREEVHPALLTFFGPQTVEGVLNPA